MDTQSVTHSLGYLVVLLLVMGEYMGIPLPGETALMVAAAASGAVGALDLGGVIAAGALGSIIGANVGYWFGRRSGRPLLEWISTRLRVKPAQLQRAERLFARYRGLILFFGRFVALFRVITALLAGISGMRYSIFLGYTITGSLLWATLISLVGHTFGRNLPWITRRLSEAGWIVVSLGILAVVGYLVWHRRAHAQK